MENNARKNNLTYFTLPRMTCCGQDQQFLFLTRILYFYANAVGSIPCFRVWVITVAVCKLLLAISRNLQL